MLTKDDQLHRTEVDHSQWSIFCLVKDPVSCSKTREVKRFFSCCGKQIEYFLTIPTKEDQLQKMKVWPLPMVKLLFDEASGLPSKRRIKIFWLLWEADRIFSPIPKFVNPYKHRPTSWSPCVKDLPNTKLEQRV